MARRSPHRPNQRHSLLAAGRNPKRDVTPPVLGTGFGDNRHTLGIGRLNRAFSARKSACQRAGARFITRDFHGIFVRVARPGQKSGTLAIPFGTQLPLERGHLLLQRQHFLLCRG